MLVFLVRHAHSDPGDPDELRSLSARGRDEAQGLATRLGAHETPPRLVFTSPFARARETAELVAEAVVVVGHQPDCSEIAAELGAGEHDFAPAGFVEIERA